MTNVVISQGSRSVNVYGAKVTRKIQKKWSIQPIPVTTNRRKETTTSVAASAGNSSITVASATNLSAKDGIYISGLDGTNFNSEVQTIKSVSGSVLTLEGTLNSSYDSGAAVVKLARFISFDFNQIVWQVTIDGWLNAADVDALKAVADDLEIMILNGGTVKAVLPLSSTAQHSYDTAAITSVIIEEQTDEPVENHHVIITLHITTKELGT